MHRVLLFIALCFSFESYAQNYQCLQGGVKHYFTNASGYLKGIRVDSVKAIGSNTIYFPFHTPRGDYFTNPVLDVKGGSWLGKEVIQQSDGNFLFDNLFHDTVVIKTQANVGDSWIFYDDTTAQYYRATIISSDTLTILGALDSVKTINITAYNSSGPMSADLSNDLKIVLSKNHGFYQAIDLFTFPYHEPNPPDYTHIWNRFDYFLDMSTFFHITSTLQANLQYKLTPFVNPTYVQLYDWNVGDVFEFSRCEYTKPSTGLYPYQYYLDTIISKTIIPGGMQYDGSGWAATQVTSWPLVADAKYPYALSNRTSTFIVSNDLLIDTTYMPEEHLQKSFVFFRPDDTSFGYVNCMYEFYPVYIDDSVVNMPVEGHSFKSYKKGIGLVHYYDGIVEIIPPRLTDTTLVYFCKSGSVCPPAVIPSGIITSIDNLQKHNETAKIYPNPTESILTIENTSILSSIIISNLIGQTVYTNECNTEKVQINVAYLQAGLYFVRINGVVVKRFVKK